MLHLYNLDKKKISGLIYYKDLNIESTLTSGDKTLLFLYPTLLSKEIIEECYIRTKTDEFIVKEITGSGSWKSIKAVLNVEDLEGKEWEQFETIELTVEQCLNLACAGTGWTVEVNGVTKKRTIRKTNCSSWDIIQQIKKTYLIEIKFDTINKIIKVYDKIGSDKGVYFIDSLNLRSLEIQNNSYEFYTRLVAMGKDNLKVIVENHQYSNKKKTLIWKDERYTNIESLTEDATAKLNDLSKPYRSYGADILDLANVSKKYNVLSYELGDTITLISKEEKVRDKQRIVKIKEYPYEPEKNTCEISNTILRFEDIQQEYQETTDTVTNITSDNGTVSEAAIKSAVNNLTLDKVNIDMLNAALVRIGSLEATSATITQLKAYDAQIEDLYSTKATIVQLNAYNGRIDLLESRAATIDNILAGNIGAENMRAGAITAGSGIIANGAIGDAHISSLSAVKIDSGIINTSNVTIQGNKGRLKVTGDRLQVFDGVSNLYERVCLGDINGDGSTYGVRVRGSDGSTILLDQNGVTKEGFTDGYNKLEDKSLPANKLDIDSVVTEINNGDTHIIGSKVLLNDKTLDVEINDIKINVNYKVEIISTNGNIINNTDYTTLLMARVYHGIDDVTDTIDANRFRWTRISDDKEGDVAWNAAHFSGSKQVLVSKADILRRATFQCDILNEDLT